MNRWTDARMDELRATTDPLADTFVADLADSGQLPALFRFLGGHGPASPEVQGWLEAHAVTAIDLDRLRQGQAVFARYSGHAMTALLCKGLPEAYAAPKGASHLLIAGRFAREPRDRLMETSRFLLDVMQPGSFEAGEAQREILKVRLVHAIARRFVRAHPSWDPATGEPLNQEDMAGTLMAFGSVVLDGLGYLGVDLTSEEEADYLYVWQVVGPLLGVQGVPADPEDGRSLMAAIRDRQHGPSPAGAILTRALLDACAEMIPGEWMDGLPAALIWHLCGAAIAGYLEVPEPGHARLLVRALELWGRVADEAEDASGVNARLADPLGRAWAEAVYRYGSEGRRLGYRPPG